MKKLLALLLALMLILTGCSLKGKKKLAPLPEEISSDITVIKGETTQKAKLQRNAEETVVTYTFPTALDSLVIKKTATGIQSSFLGLEFSVNDNFATENSTVTVIHDVLDFVIHQDIANFSVDFQGDKAVIDGEVNKHKFRLTRYIETPEIISIYLAEKDLLIKFE